MEEGVEKYLELLKRFRRSLMHLLSPGSSVMIANDQADLKDMTVELQKHRKQLLEKWSEADWEKAKSMELLEEVSQMTEALKVIHRAATPYQGVNLGDRRVTDLAPSGLGPKVLSKRVAAALEAKCEMFKDIRGILRDILRAGDISSLADLESDMEGLYAKFEKVHSRYHKYWATLKSNTWNDELGKLRRSDDWKDCSLQLEMLRAVHAVTSECFKLELK